MPKAKKPSKSKPSQHPPSPRKTRTNEGNKEKPHTKDQTENKSQVPLLLSRCVLMSSMFLFVAWTAKVMVSTSSCADLFSFCSSSYSLHVAVCLCCDDCGSECGRKCVHQTQRQRQSGGWGAAHKHIHIHRLIHMDSLPSLLSQRCFFPPSPTPNFQTDL